MKKTLLTAAMAIVAVSTAFAQSPMHMSFSNMSASAAFKVISLRTGANIVYVGKDAGPISLDVTVNTAEDAIRAAVSAGGLSYRKVNDAYIVASAESMRHALEPYSVKAQYRLQPGIGRNILKFVQDAYPDATVSLSGDKLVFVGIPEDVEESRGLIHELELRETQDAAVSDVVSVAHSNPTDVAKAVASLWPDLRTSSSGDEKGGVVMVFGPRREVNPAIAFARQINAAIQSAPADSFRVYEIKYMSASKLEAFMKEAAPGVEAYIAPENYSPKRAMFNPLTSQISSAAGGGTSSSGGVSGGSSSPGSSNQGSSGGSGTSTGSSGGAAGSQEEPNSRAKRLVLRGPAAQLDAAIRMLESIDIKSQQIFVEVKVVETSPSFEDNEGFTWGWSPLQFFEAPPGSVISTINNNTRGLNTGQYSRAPFNFNSVLNAQVVKGEAKVLANPKVGVLDNDGASIFIGDTINALVSTSVGLGAITSQIASFQVGIILLIHPRINPDGNITMHINPVISTVTGITNGLPQTSSREAETTMIIKDGETVVLGGLIQDSFSKTVTEVPFLSKLPIIGELFRNRSTKHDRTDVIITITPHIMKDAEPGK